jgi:hypothetical protein
MDWQNAIFAPGWVWSLLSLVLVVGSLAGLYRQLRLQSSQNANAQMDGFEHEWASEGMLRSKFPVLVALRDGADAASIPDGPAFTIATFWERVGGLIHAGHMDPELLHRGEGIQSQYWWAALKPWVQRGREIDQNPGFYEYFEKLAGIMDELDRRAGLPIFDGQTIAGGLSGVIARTQERIRVEEAIRTVIIAAPPADPHVTLRDPD